MIGIIAIRVWRFDILKEGRGTGMIGASEVL